ncbi:hypothetical protein HD806DRAFT_520232 [Xylariaceae sp. AK1471]|nr:hypothetical protein HD806DRAFT_520232 [Xylariaceae sp. AK1471]
MSSQCNTVFRTPELLEAILSQLDMRTLLVSAQLVNREWCELVGSSPTIQKALYFEPITQTSKTMTQNPLLVEVFPLWFREIKKKDEVPNEHSRFKRDFVSFRREDFYQLPMADKSRRDAFMHPDATWRRMLVRQPPALRLGRWTRHHGMGGDSQSFHLHEFPDGLRMGIIYDWAMDWAVAGSFRVAWDPSQVSLHGSGWYGRSLNSVQQTKLTTFTEKVDVVLCCFMTISCVMSVVDEGEWFRQTFSHPRAKYLDVKGHDEENGGK